jgi:hypothetical protein
VTELEILSCVFGGSFNLALAAVTVALGRGWVKPSLSLSVRFVPPSERHPAEPQQEGT